MSCFHKYIRKLHILGSQLKGKRNNFGVFQKQFWLADFLRLFFSNFYFGDRKSKMCSKTPVKTIPYENNSAKYSGIRIKNINKRLFAILNKDFVERADYTQTKQYTSINETYVW